MGCLGMEAKTKSLIVVVVVLMSTFYLASMILPVSVKATTLYVGGTGPGNYTTIQSAIDDATPGDTIYVFSGIYSELVKVDKTLSLVGEDRNETIIDGMGLGHVVNITADWVNFTGFKVTGGGSGNHAAVYLFGVQDCYVANNNASSNIKHGIYLVLSDNNTITNNVLWDNYFGIYLWDSNGNDIVGNIVSSGTSRGINLLNSDNNTVSNNFVKGNRRGIALWWGSTGNTLINNTALSNNEGIYLDHSNSNDVINNAVSSSYSGIYLEYSDNNTAMDNHVWNNKKGFRLVASDGNTVADNTVILNIQHGMTLAASRNNSIHHNNLINNSQQAYDDLDTNQWDDGYPSGGNYWSDYTGVDVFSGPNQDVPGSDGKGDTPYVIDTDSEDRYPLVAPVPRPPSAPLNLSATAGDREMTLTWDPPSFNGSLPITSYRIYRGTAPGGEVFFAEIGNVLTHLDTGLTNGQMYCYKVSAVNGVGEGPLSNEACATPTSVPGAPKILQADLSGKDLENVTLTWSPSSDDGAGQRSVVSYAILRGTTYDSNGFGYVPHAFVPNGTSEFVDNLAGEGDPNNYFYQVCAIDLNDLTNCSKNQGGKFTRPLSEGPNLISIPLVQSNDGTETVLQTVKWDKAWSYNSSLRKWKWNMKFKPYLGELGRVDLSMGLWVNVTELSNLTVAGVVPSTTSIRLYEGWNLVGFPSFQQDCTVGDLKVSVAAERVEGFDALASPYFLNLLIGGDTLQAGFGFWVKTTSETTWIVANS